MGGERVETPILTEMRPCKMWNLRNRHIGRREENNPLDHINVPHQPVVVQDDPQHVAAVRGMLHVPLPQPQQTGKNSPGTCCSATCTSTVQYR